MRINTDHWIRRKAQVLFFDSDEECETSYGDRQEKYQGQMGVQGMIYEIATCK